MTPEEKAALIVALLEGRTTTFTKDGVRISVSNVHLLAGFPSVVCYAATASTGQGQNRVDLPVDTEYRIQNIPLMIPDGLLDAKGRKTFVRNDLEAAKQAVYDQVTDYARSHGWQG